MHFEFIFPRLDSAEWYCSATKCYNFKGEKSTWSGARDYCAHLGATLRASWNASLFFSSKSAEFITLTEKWTFTGYWIWINCNDQAVEGDFECQTNAEGAISHFDVHNGSKHHARIRINIIPHEWDEVIMVMHPCTEHRMT